MKKQLIGLMLLVLPLSGRSQQVVDLSGSWQVTAGGEQQTIVLPNTLDGAGIGEPNTLEPMLQKPQLSRLTRKHAFIGEARYEREITIPKAMAGRPLELSLERVMWRSRVAIDGRDLAQTEESLVSPHLFYIKDGLTEGSHTLTLTIDNRKLHDISVDNLAHSYTNDTQIMWNGVLGRMSLALAPAISDVQVYPDIDRRQIRIKVEGAAQTFLPDGRAVSPTFMLDGRAVSPTKTGEGEYVLPISDMRLWSEFTPHLYTLSVAAGGQQRTVTFGILRRQDR